MLSSGDSSQGKLRYFELTSPKPYHWLRVLPLSRGGAPARGADVIIRQGKSGEGIHIQRRLIDGGSGYGSIQEPVAHFGLGEDARSPVEVTVRWPDGAVSVDMIDIDTMVMFDHPLAATAPSSEASPGDKEEASETATKPPKSQHGALPKPHGGAAALLGAMMGRRSTAGQRKNVTSGNPVGAARIENGTAVAANNSPGGSPSGNPVGRIRPRPKRPKLAPGLARMLRRH
jgi:hypothetical protein